MSANNKTGVLHENSKGWYTKSNMETYNNKLHFFKTILFIKRLAQFSSVTNLETNENISRHWLNRIRIFMDIIVKCFSKKKCFFCWNLPIMSYITSYELHSNVCIKSHLWNTTTINSNRRCQFGHIYLICYSVMTNFNIIKEENCTERSLLLRSGFIILNNICWTKLSYFHCIT